MKRIAIPVGITCTVVLCLGNCTRQDSFLGSDAAYLQQKPPQTAPQVFAPGIASTEAYNETGCTFSNDGREFYFTRSGGDLETPTIFSSEFRDNKWTEPKEVMFEGFGPHISPDGKLMIFSKYRITEEKQRSVDLWRVIRKNNEWIQPRCVGLGSRASTSYSGTVYFLDRSNMKDRGTIALREYVSGHYQDPEILRGDVNSPHYEAHPCIAKDESYLIFDSNRPGGYGEGDLYICFRDKNGLWRNVTNLGKSINSKGWDGYASISPDGEFLFYSSNRDGNFQLYWVTTAMMEQMSPCGIEGKNRN